MSMTPEIIRDRIQAALPDARVEVRDTTGGGDHFSALVVTAAFAGKMLIERHRMVYAALGVAMQSDIHALQLTTLTPEETTKR